MKEKGARQAQIRRILEKVLITTQRQPQRLLARRGSNVTQATLSRDLKELGIIYARGPAGQYIYKIIPTQIGPPPQQDLKSRFSRYVLKVTQRPT